MQEPSDLIPAEGPWQPVLPGGELDRAGKAANQAAARHRFSAYRQRRAGETLRRQEADLGLFAQFLTDLLDIEIGDLSSRPQTWRGITWGLVEAFIKWQLEQGYAVSSINVHLSTIKSYARLAMQAGVLTDQDYALIRAVQGYSRKERRRLDGKRLRTRIGAKKENPVTITPDQAQALKFAHDLQKGQGRRDSLLMCLLLDHGLRVGEVAALLVEELDLNLGQLRFYRPKVGKEQVHRLSADTLRAARAYAGSGDMPAAGFLLRRSKKNEDLGKAGMTGRAITMRVSELGKHHGLFGLSAHDCRHYWATSAARHGTDPFTLQEAGGWSSLAMPRRYIEDNKIANEGIRLQPEPRNEMNSGG